MKQINDAHGHQAGDRALQEIADVVSDRLRDSDVLARIGGDEFAVLLPHADAAQAQAISTDLRRITGTSVIDLDDGTTLPVPASVGFALIDRDSDSDEILAQADRAMYQDKTRRAPRGSVWARAHTRAHRLAAQHGRDARRERRS